MYNKLKSEHLQARKNRNNLRASLLVGVIADIDQVVMSDRKKSVGEYVVPDAVALSVLKGTIKTLNAAIDRVLSKVGECFEVNDMREKVAALSMFLPEAVEGDALRLLIQGLGATNMGQAMGKLKALSVSQGFDYDGKEAADIAKGVFV